MESLRPRRLSEILRIVWKKKHVLALMSFAMLTATFFVIRRVPPKYESTSMIIVGKQASENQRVEQAPRFSALIDQISSRDNIIVLIRKFDLYPELPIVDEQIQAFQKDLKDLKAATKVRDFYPNVPESVKITYRYRDPAKAQQIVQELTNAFTLANVSLKQESANEAQRLAAKIADVEAQLQKIGPKKDLPQLRIEMLAKREDPALAMGRLQQRATTEQTVETLRDDIFRLESQIAQKKVEIADQEKIVKQASMIPSMSVSTAMGTLMGKKAEIEARINVNTAKGYKPKHPEMMALSNELAQIEQQIARMEASPTQNAEANKVFLPEHRELRKLQSELRSLEAQINLTNRKLIAKSDALQKMPAIPLPTKPDNIGDPVQESAAIASYDKLLTHYGWLLNKQDEMIKAANSDDNSPFMYHVVEKPYLPQFPVAPNKLLLHILALAVALSFGLLVAFGSELPKIFLINDEHDIEYYLGASVLAAIPETLTPIERSHKRKLKMTRGLLLLILVGALVPVFIILLNVSQIFHILGNK